MASSVVLASEEYSEFFTNKTFLLSDDEKDAYLDELHCSKEIKCNTEVETFKTRTSHWVKTNKCRNAAYNLFKVKRWYLADESLIFDPLRKCEARHTLIPSDTIWRNFHGNETVIEGLLCVDSMVNACLRPHQTEKFEILRKLDEAMAPLQENVGVQRKQQRDDLCDDLLVKLSDIPDCAVKAYTDFVASISNAMHLHVNGVKLHEAVFETTFLKFVECLAECIGGRHNLVRCERNVLGSTLDKIFIPVKKDVKLEIASQPDLFLYKASRTGTQILVFGVTEVKGMVNDELVPSDSEDEGHSHDDTQCQHLKKEKNDDDDGDDDQGGCNDENQEDVELKQRLLNTTPTWLKKISCLPDRAQKALKTFLPQLIGEMMCCARSKAFRAVKAEDGLLFGIGVAGFDIYFVTMLDSCRRRTSKSVVNNDSACTQVFVTRPFNIRNREDRRIIMKILTAAFQLCKDNALL